MNDKELLTKFAETKSEAAFRALVERHLPLVFGVARRITRDGGLAEDIAQTVFLLLARKANQAARESVLSGWLFRTTRFVSLRALRSEQRRKNRERIAITMSVEDSADALWQQVTPELDEALAKLNETDRRALLLRFFEGHTLARVGETLGLSEEAAKKRVSRAVEKLRELMAQRGVQISSNALVAGLAHEAAAAIPQRLAEQIASAGLASMAAGGGAVAGGLLAEVLRALQIARLKIAATAVVGLGLALFVAQTAMLGSHNNPQAAGSNAVSTVANIPPSAERAVQTPTHLEIYGERVAVKGLRIHVHDRDSGTAIAGAHVKHSLRNFPPGVDGAWTDNNGSASLIIPANIPVREMSQFDVFINAAGYAPRTINWLSSTGSVLQTVGHDYNVKLERGVLIGGTIVDDANQPLADVKIGVRGSNHRGYTYHTDEQGRMIESIVRTEDHAAFTANLTDGAIITDRNGRFVIENFPSDLKGLLFEMALPNGAQHKFMTEGGRPMTAEKLPAIPLQELLAQTAVFRITRGVDVYGIVVDGSGKPVPNALVIESVATGNLQILSRNSTDAAGKFHLPNRKPREVLLSGSAPGFGSVTKLITIAREMEPSRLELPAESPLYGRVADSEGRPIADASVELIDYLNDEFGLPWNVKTQPDGRFVWTEAPTNELIIQASATGFAAQIARVKAGTHEHLITLQAGNRERVRYTGAVTDEMTGEPIKDFEVKVHSVGSHEGLPDYLKQQTQGRDGKFSIDLDFIDLHIGAHDMLGIVVEAADYETTIAAKFLVQEGDQDLQIKMRPGGIVTGDVVTPDGQPAAGATVIIVQLGKSAGLNQNSGSFNGEVKTHADEVGHFAIRKPILARFCAVSHDTGWALEPIPANGQMSRVQLQRWASVQVVFDRSAPRGSGSKISLHSQNRSSHNPLYISLGFPAENDSFDFPRIPAGDFTAALVPMTRAGMVYFYSLQTNFTLAAGERRIVELKAEGIPVLAKVKLPPDFAEAGGDVVSTLTRDVAIPQQRGAEYFATQRSWQRKGNEYWTDPAIVAARKEERAYFGRIDERGHIDFGVVPPGRYLFESKLLSVEKGSNREPRVAAQARATVEISGAAAQDIGVFELESN